MVPTSLKALDQQDVEDSKRLGPEVFAARFQECYQRLWVVAVAILRDRHLAEDIVQEAAVVGWTRIEQYKPGTNFAAWMAQIVRLQAFNSSRKRTRRKTHNVQPETLDTHCSTPEQVGAFAPDTPLSQDQAFFDDQVMRALNGIEEVARTCLLLKTIHHLSYNEIAELLDIAPGTAMSHVHRSKTLLRKQLAEYQTNDSSSLSS